uniref:Uncharacterized protein n=1 Tax=Davidia involucrata TaxID=16924 RepID=A0A5B7B6Q7_DAVIN
MEEHNTNPTAFNSVDVDKVLHSNMVYWNKKRKFQGEQLGLPLSKHKCWDRKFNSECDFPSNESLEAEDFHISIIKGKTDVGARDDGLDQESAKDSNSFAGDTDSAMSVSGEAKNDSEYANSCPYDHPSTSSRDCGSSSFKNSLYSLDSRLVTKSGVDKQEPPYIGREHNSPHHDFGLHTSLNLDEHLLEFGNQIDYSCSEQGNDSIEQCTDKELEDLLYSSGPNSNNYVLSSGRWSVNQETQPGTKKLTIDKEFEQYFSMLML